MYAAANGAIVAQASVDVIANNLANVSTNGFKRSFLQVEANEKLPLFRSQLEPGPVRQPGVPVMTAIGAIGMGSRVFDTPVSLDQGSLAVTGNPLDIALRGPGFLTTQDGQGRLSYTRDGQMLLNAQGQLCLANGDLVLGQGGPINLPEGANVHIDAAGNIYTGAQFVDRLRLTQFLNAANSRPEGVNRRDGTIPVPATTTDVSQGALEKSNADVVRSMVDLISAQRWFDANQKVIQTEDDTTNVAITQVGHAGQ
jgi:flagellar basal-body rod protein FlgG